MAGAVGAAARGAMEAGERDGGSAASRLSRYSGRGRGQGVVWDHVAFPKEKAVEEVGHPTLLSPAERVFAEVRRWVEGRRYECTEAKKAAGGCCEGWRLGGRSHRW